VSTGAKRLLAVVVALALIGVALGARAAFLDGGDDTGSSDGGDGTQRLLCSTEVAAACDELAQEDGIQVDVVPAGQTVDELSSLGDSELEKLGYDGWLTFQRDAEAVAVNRQSKQLAPALDASSDPIGRTPLVLGAWKERADALAPTCGGRLTWKCLGDVAGLRWSTVGGQPAWGDVKPGHADPQLTAEGLAIIGQAAAQYFGRSDIDRSDVQDNDAFLGWFSRLEQSVPFGTTADTSAFEAMLAAGPAAFDVVATTEAVAGPSLAAAARDRRKAVTLIYPSPVATADVVYAPVRGRGSDLGDTVTGDDGRAALARAGFRVEGEDRAPGVPNRPPLPSRSNLPDAGTLVALLQTWREVTG
jgi:Bacterial extracellular solute-binding protein